MEKKSCESVVRNEERDHDTVEHIKHPLNNRWDMWMYTNKCRVWKKNLVHLTSFDTVEDYWCADFSLYHHMIQPLELKVSQDLMLFKDGIEPMWEHDANNKGGRWLIAPEKQINVEMNSIWLGVVLLMIGDNFDNSDILCGAIFNRRTKNKICVWTKNAQKKPNVEIAKKIREKLGIPFKLLFYLHNSSSVVYTV